MRRATRTGGRSDQDRRSGGERWRPLAHHLAGRFAGRTDEAMVEVAMVACTEAERRSVAHRADPCALAVRLSIRALRRDRRERIRRRPTATEPFPAIQVAIVAAEDALSRRLRRSPTVAEVADHLDIAQHQIVAALEACWSADGARRRPGER